MTSIAISQNRGKPPPVEIHDVDARRRREAELRLRALQGRVPRTLTAAERREMVELKRFLEGEGKLS
jgi:hypothetical protein